MSNQYASNQPSGFKNHIINIALVGASGQVGRHILTSLLENPNFKITVLTRTDSTTKLPSNVKSVTINYDDESSIVSALQGIEAFIITMAVTAPADQQSKLIRAAAKAQVPWILPNEYGTDGENEQMANDVMVGPKLRAARQEIESLGVSSWIGITCGFWYEYSLGCGENTFGFDFAKREVVFFDEGTEKMNTSTWPQTGRGVAKLLALKILPDNENDNSPSISRWRNRHVYVSSFLVNQKDMFESVKRVTGTADSDWKIRYESSKERVKEGHEMMKGGNRMGFARAMYSRVFFPTGEANWEAKGKLDNEVLGLPKENIDEFTKKGIEKFEKGGFFYRGD